MMSEPEPYRGILAIGDPHLEARTPGFRKDDYPQVVLGKLRWALEYAAEHALMPIILGDLFNLPRDNPNWLLGDVISLFQPPIHAVVGNHDCHDRRLSDDDSLNLLVKAGRVILLDSSPWKGQMNWQNVLIGGTSWGSDIPTDRSSGTHDSDELTIWITHHEISLPGYEAWGHIAPHEIPGVDLVINGHIHMNLGSVRYGETVWVNPGNIARRDRSNSTQNHTPSVLAIHISSKGWHPEHIEVPHGPFDEVFYESVVDDETSGEQSGFVRGLAELQARRTETGAGLIEFLEQNLDQFDESTAAEIWDLAREVTAND